MAPFLPSLSLATAALALALQLPAVAAAAPLLAQAGGATRNTAFFEKAKRDLPEKYYFIYRVVDRLARANGLDQSPWRVLALPKYDMNAFATEANLIAVYAGMLDVLAGDASAIACVIGHEMAHHVQRHIPQTQVDKTIAQQRLAARQQQLAEEEEKRQSNRQSMAFIQGLLRTTTGINLPMVGDDSNAQATTQDNLKQATTAESQALLEKGRAMEFEADRYGYHYMVRAGFDPQGCVRMMEVLSRLPEAEFDTTHPAIPRRAQKLRELMVESSTSQLAGEGRARLMGTSALTYSVSEDGRSLRVNSRFGSSKGNTFINDL